MAVANAADELLEEVPRLEFPAESRSQASKVGRGRDELGRNLILAEPSGVADSLEELAAGGVFHHDREMRRREHDLNSKPDVKIVIYSFFDLLAWNEDHGGGRKPVPQASAQALTSLKRMMLGCRSDR